MSRTRASALALVNWKGVFYERYLLDPHVTALEGANGAGKTTVMVAAYVVLMPDLSRLRFSNVGESGGGAGDRGLEGRLGEAGRPSFAALELHPAAGPPVVAGVQLLRRAGGLGLTPFVFSGVDLQGSLKELLLLSDGEHDAVPELAQVAERAAALGGSLKVHASVKEYFADLFARGITPLRLSGDEERKKMNELLRTSMTGGISRALTSELRSFLLREDSGLSDVLGRMRESLSACRRTRGEVREAQHLEVDIGGVYDAGNLMHRASWRAQEQRLGEAEEWSIAAGERAQAARRELDDLDVALRDVAAREEAQRRAVDEAVARLAETERNEQRALRQAELEQASARLRELHRAAQAEHEHAERERDRLAAARTAAVQRRDEARVAYERAARGLGDLQRGLEELHRRAHAEARGAVLVHELEELGRAWPSWKLPSTEASAIMLHAGETGAARRALDMRLAGFERAMASREVRREEFEEALEILRRLDPSATPDTAHARARSVLAELHADEARLSQRPALQREVDELQARVQRNALARAEADALGIASGEGARERVAAAFDRAHEQARRAELEMLEQEREQRRLHEALTEAERELSRLSVRGERVARAERLRASLAALLPETADMDPRALRQRVHDAWRGMHEERSEHQRRQEDASERALRLERGPAADPELVRLAELVQGELLLSRFDELDEQAARRVEAELGPLAHAIVVDDPEQAAARLSAQPRTSTSLTLIREGAPLGVGAAKDLGADQVMVAEGPALRLVRLPERSSLGQRARREQALELRAHAEAEARVVDELSERIVRLGALRTELEAVDDDDFAQRAFEILRATAEGSVRGHRLRLAELESTPAASVEELRGRADRLRALLAVADRLEDDAEPRWQRGVDELARIEARAESFERCQDDRLALELRVEILRTPPEDDASWQARVAAAAEQERERDALAQLESACLELASLGPLLGAEPLPRAPSQGLAPALEAQCESARVYLAAREQELGDQERQWEQAVAQAQHCSAVLLGRRDEMSRVQEELVRTALPPGASTDSREARQHRDRVVAEREANAELRAQLGERRRHLGASVEASEAAARAATERLELAQGEAQAFLAEAEALGLQKPEGEAADGAGMLDARALGSVLVERLAAAKGGESCRDEVETAVRQGDPLRAWASTRQWISRRLPAPLALASDPMLGLGRLRVELADLARRLERHEGELRGTSGDVAHAIDVQIRRAKGVVRRMNQQLAEVSFGSVSAIRVELQRVSRMDDVLGALRDGRAQELLFDPSLPIEEAFDEIFRRFGGGPRGGDRVLDYREYVELQVLVQRRGREEWELATPARLSTGEAIGVGASLMMVVLTEWERDASLFRARGAGGSLRFLFLDEANRLSQDNLGVLFELCKNLELQLLLAAPEVAHAEGNTTYRLVRRVGEGGHDEVLVTGRRSTGAEPVGTAPSAPTTLEIEAAAERVGEPVAAAAPGSTPALDVAAAHDDDPAGDE